MSANVRTGRLKKAAGIVLSAIGIWGLGASMAAATPSTQIWIPSTDIQPYKTVHLNFDAYLRANSNDDGSRTAPLYVVGPTVGVLPFEKLQAEVGFDLMSAGGGGAQKISIGGYCDSAAFSPDGKKLAYICREKGEFNIYMADLATGALTQLTSGTGKNEDPSWAPSSNHIVFQRGSGMYIMNVNTKKAKDLGAPGAQPVWGPLSN